MKYLIWIRSYIKEFLACTFWLLKFWKTTPDSIFYGPNTKCVTLKATSIFWVPKKRQPIRLQIIIFRGIKNKLTFKMPTIRVKFGLTLSAVVLIFLIRGLILKIAIKRKTTRENFLQLSFMKVKLLMLTLRLCACTW